MCHDMPYFQSRIITIIILDINDDNNNNRDNAAVRVKGWADEELATGQAPVFVKEHLQRNLNSPVSEKVRSYISNENLLRSKQ